MTPENNETQQQHGQQAPSGLGTLLGLNNQHHQEQRGFMCTERQQLLFEHVPRRRTLKESQELEASIRAAARNVGLTLVVGEIRSTRGITLALHWQFFDSSGKHVLDYWPSTAKWRRPDTAESGTEPDPRVILEQAKLFGTQTE
jgi:hypothetical protein